LRPLDIPAKTPSSWARWRAIVARARRQRKRAVLLLCKHELIGFYERLGFVSRGLSDSAHGGFAWYQMRLPLLLEATE
jgi:hypothetical protein